MVWHKTINREICWFYIPDFFLMFVVYMCFVCWGEGVNHRYGEWIKISLFYQYWFVQSYILLFLFSPILNASVKMLERRTLFLVLTSLFITQIVYGFLPCANNYGWYNNGYSALTFFFSLFACKVCEALWLIITTI